ncbi:hypothetical protein MKW94_003297 [Papaver nudicaule]|uniref:protein-serine/threonine phosphatase n=1 Tax=Papaver nudicaule TaxID=74823 RepID=A0AA41VF51_PAPNU|nr:hypothetical protein [Papaver nudicaule]
MFEMCVYTMGNRSYAEGTARLLDPGKIYFDWRVISKEDCTHENKKSLDVVLGAESVVIILDDTKYLGATCCKELDSSVTHVVSTDMETRRSRWAVKHGKFLVHPRWIKAAYSSWKRQLEDSFVVGC